LKLEKNQKKLKRFLNRDVFIADNTLIGAETVRGSWVVDAHAVTIDFFVTRNKIYPQLPYFYAFSDGTQQSTFTNNEIYGGYGGIFKRGRVSDGVHIYENNTFNDMAGEIYRGGDGIDNTLIIRNNTQNKGIYGIRFPYKGSVRNIIISNNKFSNLSNQGMNQKFLMNGVNLTLSENTFANIKYEGIYLDGNSFKNGAVKIKNNTLINVNPPNYSSGITVKNVQNAEISGNKISETPVPKAPVADFSASPTSGKAPLKVKFKSTSTGDPTAWKWNFGDGSALVTEQNPEHTYSKTGVYTVKHTAINTYGRDTEIKTSYIKVTTSAKPVAAFSASPTSGKAPLNVAFTDKSTGSPTSWKWSFGDGTYSTVKSPVHKYTKAGKYTVSLTVKNAKGSNAKTMSGYLTVSKK
jgi:PKD repeat protein